MSRSWRRRIGTGTNQVFFTLFVSVKFQSRYQVLGKLGYGSRSTAWLCRDLRWVRQRHQVLTPLSASIRGHKYVTLKVCLQDCPAIRRELAGYNHLDTIMTSNPGALLVRELLDSFKATGPAGEHQCLVHAPLSISIETLRQLIPGRKLPENILKLSLLHLLKALDFLHTDAEMVHAGNKQFA